MMNNNESNNRDLYAENLKFIILLEKQAAV